MPNYVRWRREGASYFFTVVPHRRRRVFDAPLARRLSRQAITETRNRWPFDVFAMVLLPDHLHCLWTLPRDDDRFPARWGHIKKTFTQQYIAAGGKPLSVSKNRARHREQGIWQQRYWEHRIRDEADWYRHRDYIHLNPVKHGYVSEPQAWPWSSIHRHIQLGWLDPDWPGSSPIEIPDVLGE